MSFMTVLVKIKFLEKNYGNRSIINHFISKFREKFSPVSLKNKISRPGPVFFVSMKFAKIYWVSKLSTIRCFSILSDLSRSAI